MSVIHLTEPTIKHTTVTVQNVMIGKRQLTQRVFKQIREADIFSSKPETLNGEAWGYVNYFWKGCSNFGCKHILWITPAGELRRCRVKTGCYRNGHRYEHVGRFLTNKLPQLYIAT